MPESKTQVALDVKGLNAFYGPAQALFNVSLQVEPGEFVVLQGLNGAGKSTLLKALMGLEVRSEGVIDYQTEAGRQNLAGWDTHRRAQAGLGYVAEDRRLFTGLTVHENLRVAAGAGRDSAGTEARVLDLFPVLKTMLKRPASQMNAVPVRACAADTLPRQERAEPAHGQRVLFGIVADGERVFGGVLHQIIARAKAQIISNARHGKIFRRGAHRAALQAYDLHARFT